VTIAYTPNYVTSSVTGAAPSTAALMPSTGSARNGSPVAASSTLVLFAL